MKPLDRRLLRHARATWLALAAAALLGCLAAALAVAQAGLLATAIASAIEDDATPTSLAGLLAALALVLAARSTLAWGQEVASFRASAAVKSALRRQLLARAAAMGPRWSSERRSAEVVTLATQGLDALDAYFARYLPQLVLAVLVPLAVVGALLFVDLVAALTVALTVPLIPLFMALVGRATEARRERRWLALSRLAHHFVDLVAGLPTLKAFGRSRGQLQGLRQVTDDYRRESLGTLRIAFLSAFVLELCATLSVALVAVGIGLRLVAGELDLRTGLFVIVLAPEAYLPLRQLGVQFHASQEGLTAAGAAFALIEAPPDLPGGRAAVPAMAGGGLRVEGVTVRHPERDLAAPSDCSFHVRGGEVVVLTGASGAGKSSLLQVILGLLPADAGWVLAVGSDGAARPVAELDGEAWRRTVAWVPQQPLAFAATVAETLAMGARAATPTAGGPAGGVPAPTPAAMTAILQTLGLGDLDLATPLGEHGLGLSSGQRRRLAVARALLSPAPLLLLDEPTAGLDATSERRVLEAIRDAARAGRAVVLVAHRPAAAAIADRTVEVVWRAAAATAGAPAAARAHAAPSPTAA